MVEDRQRRAESGVGVVCPPVVAGMFSTVEVSRKAENLEASRAGEGSRHPLLDTQLIKSEPQYTRGSGKRQSIQRSLTKPEDNAASKRAQIDNLSSASGQSSDVDYASKRKSQMRKRLNETLQENADITGMNTNAKHLATENISELQISSKKSDIEKKPPTAQFSPTSP